MGCPEGLCLNSTRTHKNNKKQKVGSGQRTALIHQGWEQDSESVSFQSYTSVLSKLLILNYAGKTNLNIPQTHGPLNKWFGKQVKLDSQQSGFLFPRGSVQEWKEKLVRDEKAFLEINSPQKLGSLYVKLGS